jgi:hypothetical protein
MGEKRRYGTIWLVLNFTSAGIVGNANDTSD